MSHCSMKMNEAKSRPAGSMSILMIFHGSFRTGRQMNLFDVWQKNETSIICFNKQFLVCCPMSITVCVKKSSQLLIVWNRSGNHKSESHFMGTGNSRNSHIATCMSKQHVVYCGFTLHIQLVLLIRLLMTKVLVFIPYLLCFCTFTRFITSYSCLPPFICPTEKKNWCSTTEFWCQQPWNVICFLASSLVETPAKFQLRRKVSVFYYYFERLTL